jgi:hypothetical protein
MMEEHQLNDLIKTDPYLNWLKEDFHLILLGVLIIIIDF